MSSSVSSSKCIWPELTAGPCTFLWVLLSVSDLSSLQVHDQFREQFQVYLTWAHCRSMISSVSSSKCIWHELKAGPWTVVFSLVKRLIRSSYIPRRCRQSPILIYKNDRRHGVRLLNTRDRRVTTFNGHRTRVHWRLVRAQVFTGEWWTGVNVQRVFSSAWRKVLIIQLVFSEVFMRTTGVHTEKKELPGVKRTQNELV